MKGAKALRRYLKEERISMLAFSRMSGIDKSQLSRILNEKEGSHMSVNVAHAIQKASKGKVPMTLWVTVK